MKVENIIDHPIDFTTIEGCKSFSEWVNGDISNAFYLGFLREELSRLMEPYLQSREGFVILDMINDVLGRVSLEKEDDIYGVAFVLGIYTDYLFTTQAEA